MAIVDKVQARVAADVVRVNKGAALQTGNLQEYQDSTGAILSRVDSAGNFIAPGGASAILNTIIDAKGDLIAGTAADTAARLAVGANDLALIADSGQATGLKWAGVILQALADAKGDLIAATAADTWARVAVGSDGDFLVADSGATPGLAWKPRRYAADFGDGAATSFTFTHNLGTRDVTYAIREVAGTFLYVAPATAEATTTNTFTVTFAVAPTASQYRIIIQS